MSICEKTRAAACQITATIITTTGAAAEKAVTINSSIILENKFELHNFMILFYDFRTQSNSSMGERVVMPKENRNVLNHSRQSKALLRKCVQVTCGFSRLLVMPPIKSLAWLLCSNNKPIHVINTQTQAPTKPKPIRRNNKICFFRLISSSSLSYALIWAFIYFGPNINGWAIEKSRDRQLNCICMNAYALSIATSIAAWIKQKVAGGQKLPIKSFAGSVCARDRLLAKE